MYLWNYISSELAENGQPATASIGFYDETNNVILFTVNENKWQVKIPEGINSRESMILFMVVNVPVLKDFIDENDKERLFNPSIVEMTPVVPESVPEMPPEPAPYNEQESEPLPEHDPYNEQVPAVLPENEIQQPQPKEMVIVQCEKCGLFYDSAEYTACPFCASSADSAPEVKEEAAVIPSINNESETKIEVNNESETVIDFGNSDDSDFAEIPAFVQPATVNFFVNDSIYATVEAKDGEEVSIGRADFCTIFCAEEKQLSRIHCTIQYNEAERTFCIKDKSLNGIFDFTGNRLPKDTAVIVPTGTRLWVATKAMMIELTAHESAPVAEKQEDDDILITGQPEEQYICGVCGGEYTPDSLFCPWCGNKLTV